MKKKQYIAPLCEVMKVEPGIIMKYTGEASVPKQMATSPMFIP